MMALLQFKPAAGVYPRRDRRDTPSLAHAAHRHAVPLIVVSLKKGLFTNANVLFCPGFRDDTSVVERTAQRDNSLLYSHVGRERGREEVVAGETVAVGAPRRARRGAAS